MSIILEGIYLWFTAVCPVRGEAEGQRESIALHCRSEAKLS